MKRTIPSVLGFISGFLIIARQFIDNPRLSALATGVSKWRVTVAAFALGLGAVNLIQIHGKALIRKDPNRLSSALLFISLLGFSCLGFISGPDSFYYKWIWDNVYQPIYSGIASLLAFMIVSASYRAFKIKDWQSAILMLSAVVVMLGQIGVGAPLLPDLSQWIMSVPNAAGMRGISIGGALGAVALSMRVLLGFERSYTGGDGQ